MMVIFRGVALMLILGFGACTLLHRVTGDPEWGVRAQQLLKWGVVLGLCFFGLIILRRAAVFI
jgi:hypothetical protein